MAEEGSEHEQGVTATMLKRKVPVGLVILLYVMSEVIPGGAGTDHMVPMLPHGNMILAT